MIGAIINTYKGIKDNREYKNRLAGVEKQLESIKSIEQLISKIDEPYNRVIAQNQILLAEYYEQRQKNQSFEKTKKLWEMVKSQMATNIEQTEKQLQNVHATKLDIARIVSSLSQLANEADLEILAIKQQLAQLHDLELPPMKQELTNLHDLELPPIKQQLANLHDLELPSIKHKLDKLHNLELELPPIKHKIGRLHDLELPSIKHKLTNLHDLEVPSIKQQLANLYASDKRIDEILLELQQQLSDQKVQLTTHIERIDESMVAVEKEQRKRILQWTIPLYVVVIGIILALFIL